MKILSISAAPGWFASFKNEDGTTEQVPLACWALVQDAAVKGESDVVGVVVTEDAKRTERADGAGNFVGYRHESEKTPYEQITEMR